MNVYGLLWWMNVKFCVILTLLSSLEMSHMKKEEASTNQNSSVSNQLSVPIYTENIRKMHDIDESN